MKNKKIFIKLNTYKKCFNFKIIYKKIKLDLKIKINKILIFNNNKNNKNKI